MTSPAPGYQVRQQTLHFGGRELRIESLLDKQQFHDPDHHAERLGVSPAHWSIFGNLWPSACLLAERVAQLDFRGRRVLEVGAGLGLASLIAQSRGADITATDIHPLCERFLDGNAARNQLPKIPFHRADWGDLQAPLGKFSLFLASDVLYESQHAGLLSGFIERHAERTAEVLMVDPSRGNQNHFARAMIGFGFVHSFELVPAQDTQAGRFAGKVHTFLRTA